MRPRTRTRIATAVCAVAVTTACAPTHRVTVGDRDIATDILLKGTPASAAPPAPLQPGFPLAPAPVTVPASGPVVPLPQVAPAGPSRCPVASPLVGARDPVTPLPPGPPRAATYSYRQSGSYLIGSGSTARGGTFPATLSHTISHVTTSTDGWSFVDTDSSGMTVTYDVYPHQRPVSQEPVPTDNAAASPTEAGIYVRSFTYKRADGKIDSLTPQPELLVAPLPLNDAGATWRAKGVDAATGITVSVDGQVGAGPHFSPAVDRIDACGTVLQAYWVEYTIAPDNGTAVDTGGTEPASSLYGPDIHVAFIGTRIAFATQYGGIPLEQTDRLRGTDGPPVGGAAPRVDITRYETISQAPMLPRST